MTNMIIIKTKIILCRKRSGGAELQLYDVLRFTCNEMLNDEYDSEITLHAENIETRLGKYMASLQPKFQTKNSKSVKIEEM